MFQRNIMNRQTSTRGHFATKFLQVIKNVLQLTSRVPSNDQQQGECGKNHRKKLSVHFV